MNDDWEYLSKSEGIGGEIKISPDEFIVEEISQDGTVMEINKKIEKPDADASSGQKGKFTHFILQKRDWTTSSAIKRLSKALRVGQKRFDYAGTKDKVACTTQLVSVFAVSKEQLFSLQLKDIQINGAWSAFEKVKTGDLLGNRFKIRWHAEKEMANAEERVSAILAELGGKFPNYFGPQRFGSIRRNTHRVGELIVRRRFQEAALHFLAEMSSEENEEARIARSHLLETSDFSLALREFPKHLRLERSMLAHLAGHSTDYIGAFRKLPRQTLLMFIHAFQSWLFNEALSARIKDGMVRKEGGEIYCGANAYGFPDQKKAGEDFLCGKLLGYDSEPNEREKEILAGHGISLSDFEIREMPELSSKGCFRPLLCPLKDFEFREGVFSFSLPSGAYATSALREFTKK
ncbi:MAG: tRNA pseudouridine(13) synthase TruD [Candidatus Bilamarchaeaceae archaeon]